MLFRLTALYDDYRICMKGVPTMKKVLFSVLLLSISLLCACQPANLNSRPNNSIAPPSNIYVGMPRDDFFALYPSGYDYSNGTCFEIWGEYAFLKDCGGNPVVVYFEHGDGSDDWYVSSVDAYDKDTINVTEEACMQLERGMNYQEIVSVLGCPIPERMDTRGLNYQVGDCLYHLECFGKTGFYDKEYVLGYIGILFPDGSISYPMGTEPWEYVDPE